MASPAIEDTGVISHLHFREQIEKQGGNSPFGEPVRNVVVARTEAAAFSPMREDRQAEARAGPGTNPVELLRVDGNTVFPG
jgi:hypothetical protein